MDSNDFEGIEWEDDSIFDESPQQNEQVKATNRDTNKKINQNNDEDDFFSDDLTPINEDKSALQLFLESKGFVDSKVKIVNDNDAEEEVDFNSLPQEDQLDILNSLTQVQKQETISGINLSPDEQEFFKQLNSHGMTLEQFLENYKDGILSETEPSYDIDSYNNEELFLLDLKNKYDLSDEELSEELEKELKNEDLFKKKVDKIREEYKTLETQHNQQREAELQANQQKEYDQFVQQVVTVATNTPDIHGFELDDDEKNKTLSYLLDVNDQGVSQFYNDLNNDEKLYELAWYSLYGKSAFKLMQDSYEAEIIKLKSKQDKPSAVRQDTRNSKEIKTIHDLI